MAAGTVAAGDREHGDCAARPLLLGVGEILPRVLDGVRRGEVHEASDCRVGASRYAIRDVTLSVRTQQQPEGANADSGRIVVEQGGTQRVPQRAGLLEPGEVPASGERNASDARDGSGERVIRGGGPRVA
jgi:hypothetical protein